MATSTRAISLIDIEEAEKRIRPFIHRTPLLSLSSSIVQMIEGVAHNTTGTNVKLDIRLKCENFQRVGAFKFRGASNAVRKIRETHPSVKIIATHSSGNHAAALALSCQLAKLESLIVVPTTAPQVKVDAILAFGGNIVYCDPTKRESTLERKVAEKRALFGDTAVEIVPSYNHPLVMAGQGTLALEILEDFPECDLVVCPIGGGGLISGVSTAIKEKCPDIMIIGVEPTMANDAQKSKEAGYIIPNEHIPLTIADGLRTNIKQLTWECIRDLVDLITDVTEDEIKFALHLILTRMKIIIEPSSATVIATLLSPQFWKFTNIKNKTNIVCIISGGNLDVTDFLNL